MRDLAGKVAFITGGAGGIGLGMAEVFREAGMHLVLADMEQGALERAEVELRRRAGGDVLLLRLDVTNRDAMKEAADAVDSRFGGIHVLCNNAGVNAPGPLQDLGYADWDWVLGVNLDGVVNGLVTFLPRMLARGEAGHIVNTASVGGLLGMPNLGIYCASKFAVVGLSESLKHDLAKTPIGVSVLAPGIVRSGIAQSERNRPEKFGGPPPKREEATASAFGTDPVDLGRQVLAAIEADAFYICTHAEFRHYVAQRGEALLSAFQGTPDPELESAMAPVVGPILR